MKSEVRPLKLKRCPFCGGHADVEQGAVFYRVRCDKCGAHTRYCRTRADAIDLWEQRADGNDK